MGPAQKIWMGEIQKRVSMTSSMLASMKSIKMMGLSEHLSDNIQSQRVRELDLAAKFRSLSIWRSVIYKFAFARHRLLSRRYKYSCHTHFVWHALDICGFCNSGFGSSVRYAFNCSGFHFVGNHILTLNSRPSINELSGIYHHSFNVSWSNSNVLAHPE